MKKKNLLEEIEAKLKENLMGQGKMNDAGEDDGDDEYDNNDNNENDDYNDEYNHDEVQIMNKTKQAN